ncbi:hypothetical protein BDV39DRAFT_201064 [Aspergillus sergii]|uniref:Zn(2)-C6 fungal-type domain-containing protein n=1 Tax=Aspergillus sergii TaxID=1034303 RepID=A0A5N6XDT2_9EURO|nr:hypothetical protein BDV39DRAFT_201064 [Aspergillus sergii]
MSPARTTRARVACASCRNRKVRCDVAHRGRPCTNCFLDHKDCAIEVGGRHDRNRARQRKRNFVPAPKLGVTPADTATTVVDTPDLDYTRPQGRGSNLPTESQTDSLASNHLALLSLLQNRSDESAEQDEPKCGPGTSDINFSVYQFIDTRFLFRLQQSDIKYLEDQACLRVPRRDLMDEMLDQYFRYIHPLLPLFDEAQFWAMYHPVKYKALQPAGTSMSLFVLQAMLFAACSVVPEKKIRRLGYRNYKHARNYLYRRAKLLYSMDTEHAPVALAQGALLLSLWCPKENERQVNTWWLTSAIQHARAAMAHRHQYLNHLPTASQVALKRLWWSCIIRDRVMALCLRQPMHLTREAYDFEAGRLTVYDIEDAEDVPGVYDKDMKRVISMMTVSMCDLCTVLTDVLALVYPHVAPTGCSPEHSAREVNRVRGGLTAWCTSMKYRFSTLSQDQQSSDEVILFSNLLHMYLHSTWLLLANYEIQTEVEAQPFRLTSNENICRCRLEVQRSTVAITDLLRELVKLDLVRYLPISAVTCSAKPLILYLLDQTLTDGAATEGQNKLTIVLEAMRDYQCRYDYTDLVLSTAHRLSLVARSMSQEQATTGWADILLRYPKDYLRFIVTMDIAIAKGSFPKDLDLPLILQTESVGAGEDECVQAPMDGEEKESSNSLSLSALSELSPPEALPILNSDAWEPDEMEDPLIFHHGIIHEDRLWAGLIATLSYEFAVAFFAIIAVGGAMMPLKYQIKTGQKWGWEV